MDKDLKIKISIDKQTGELKVVNSEFDGLSKKIKKTDTNTKSLKASLLGLAGAAGGIYAINKALSSVVKTGFAFNKSMEDSKAGLVALSVAVQDKHIPVMQRYSNANIEAANTIKELQRINVQTPHTLDQTNKIYKAMYVSMKNAGASTSDMIEMTRSLSIAAGAAGIEFNSLLAGVDGLATGTVLANSDLGRFLNGLGLTNNALKKSSDVVSLIESKLKDFKAADTMGVALSNLENSWDQLTGKMTADAFDGAKQGLNTFSDLLNSMSDDDISHARDMINGFAIGATSALYTISVGAVDLANAFDSLGARIAGVAFRLENGVILSDEESEALERMYQKTKDNIQSRNNFVDSLEKSKNALIATVETNGKVTKSQREWNKALEEFYSYDPDFDEKVTKTKVLTDTQIKEKKKTAEALKKIDEDTNADYISKLKQWEEEDKQALQSSIQTHKDYISIVGTDYEKWLSSTNDKMVQLSKDGSLSAEQLQQAWDSLQSDYEINLTINGLDDAQTSFDKMIDSQISLATGVNDWGNNLNGASKNFANVAKAMSSFKVNDLKFEKRAQALKTKYAKDALKIEKSKLEPEIKLQKEKELGAKFDKDYAQAKNEQFSNELNAYSGLAGAIGNFYEAGSTAAKAAQAVQATLGIVNGYGAITQAWASAPFPANLPGVAAATAAVLPMIAQLTSLGGSGGSGGGASAESGYQATITQNKEDIKLSYEPITNRLDQQIALLDSINRNGSSAALQNTSAAISFERDYELWKQDVFSGSLLAPVDSKLQSSDVANVNSWQESLGFSVFSIDEAARTIQLDTDSLTEGNNLLDTLINIVDTKSYAGTLGQNATDNEGSQADQIAWIDKMISDLQGNINDWAISTIDSMNALNDASQSFQDSFDNLTGSTYYADKRLQESFDTVNKIKGDSTLPDYLTGLVDSIESTNDFLTDDRFNLLLSKDPADIEAQTELLKEFGEVTGQVFEDGAQEALDYIDSIQAVADAMAASRENQESFIDQFRTPEQKVDKMAQELGVSAATSTQGVIDLFGVLSGGIDGLTDKELDFLNANLELTGTFDDLIQQYEDSISTLNSVVDTLQGTIDKLYGSVLGSSYTMQQYYDAMNKALTADLTDAKAYQELVNDAISKSSVLFDATNYQTSKDQQFAQLVAAKQFEDLQDSSLGQIDYLMKIEENTRLLAADAIGQMEDATNPDVVTNYYDGLVNDTYNKILGRDAEDDGMSYWSTGLASSSVPENMIGMAVVAAGEDSGELSRTEAITKLYEEGLGREPDAEGLDNWVNSGLSIMEIMDIMPDAAAANGETFTAFAEGGIVTKPTFSLIGEAGYNEAVIPLKDSNDPLGNKELLNAVKQLTAVVEAQANEIREIRKISEDQHTTLLDIEDNVA